MERPKASYLEWFKELVSNYKLLALLFASLFGYSGINLYKDVQPLVAADVAEVIESHAVVQNDIAEAIKKHIEKDHIPDHAVLHQ
jgi:hypothetical protein